MGYSPQQTTCAYAQWLPPFELTAGRLGMNLRAYYPSVGAAAYSQKLSVRVPFERGTFARAATDEGRGPDVGLHVVSFLFCFCLSKCNGRSLSPNEVSFPSPSHLRGVPWLRAGQGVQEPRAPAPPLYRWGSYGGIGQTRLLPIPTSSLCRYSMAIHLWDLLRGEYGYRTVSSSAEYRGCMSFSWSMLFG